MEFLTLLLYRYHISSENIKIHINRNWNFRKNFFLSLYKWWKNFDSLMLKHSRFIDCMKKFLPFFSRFNIPDVFSTTPPSLCTVFYNNVQKLLFTTLNFVFALPMYGRKRIVFDKLFEMQALVELHILIPRSPFKRVKL